MLFSFAISTVLILAAYLLGSIPTGYIVGRYLKGIDIRECGINAAAKCTCTTNDGNGNQSGNQAIFDGCCTRFVIDEILDKVLHN